MSDSGEAAEKPVVQEGVAATGEGDEREGMNIFYVEKPKDVFEGKERVVWVTMMRNDDGGGGNSGVKAEKRQRHSSDA